jgi:peroxiredoxin
MAETIRLKAGDRAPLVSFASIANGKIRAEDDDRPLHLQFRRFAGCPICHLHLHNFLRRASELDRRVREVVFFHSSVEELRPHLAHLPALTIADPDKRIYRAFGVEAHPRALLHPKAISAALLSSAVASYRIVRGRQALPARSPQGGRLGLPADFLVSRTGIILACHYGRHADDQWSVDDVLELAARKG